ARALEPRGSLRWPRRHAVLARRAPAGAGGAQVTSNPDKESVPMATDRPLVVLAGPIHPAGRANLETEARVVVCDGETEAGFVSVAADADGLLFPAKPRYTASLMAACKRLKVVGRRGGGLDPVATPAAPQPGDQLRKRGAEPVRSLQALLQQVHVLTCHTPVTDETRRMINDKTLGLMKRGAIFVNTSRRGVQQERAVFEALVKGQLAAAGLDVFEQEPTPRDNPLLNLDNVVVSSHVAGVTAEATHTATLQVTSEMLRVLRGERPHVLANPDVWPRVGIR